MMRYLKGLLLPALLALAPSAAIAAKNTPLVKVTPFKNELVNLLYFDDSTVALVQELQTGKIWRSADAGKSWDKVSDLLGLGIIKNPYDNNVALVLGESKHWITYDQGDTWQDFSTDWPPTPSGPVSWHAQDNKKVLINEIENCLTAPCLGRTYYTEDGFKSINVLVDDRRMCQWAKSSERFLEGEDKHDKRILCITRGRYSDRSKDFRLQMSDNYFDDADEPVMSSGRTVQGMANMAAVKGYLVAAAKSDHSSELSLYVTQDTETWHHAEFGNHKIEEDAYTILESTNYSIQVDVMTSKYIAMGSLYTSNSNGTYFTKNVEYTNRNADGFVDFEKVANIQGVVLVNLVDNWEDVQKNGQGKKLKSRISFDDGRSFEVLKVKGTDKELHLHSVTNLHNSGRVFSSPAPGIVMGVGNTGDNLGKYTDGDLYVSDDAGLTWELALEEAHKYEFGDQGSVLVAVFDEGDTNKIMYSLKHGRKDTWETIELDDKIRARELTTLPDSTSLKFMLYASKKKKGGGREHVIVHLDFTDLHERTCKDKDFDPKWSVRMDGNDEPSCVMGHKQLFRRRKWDAECFVGEVFKDPVPTFEPCECDDFRDFECDFNFKPEGEGKDKKCVPSESLKLPGGACEGDAKTYKGSSGWRKIPGNQCKGGSKKDEEIERQCDEAEKPAPKNDKITSELTVFKGSSFVEQYYLERDTQSGDNENDRDKDETVVMLTDERVAWITHDHGKQWKEAVPDEEIVRIYPHQYENNYVYFLTASPKVYYSEDRGLKDSIHSFEAPVLPNQEMLQIMQFHPKQKGWLIWLGGKNCEKMGSKDCHTVAYVSQKNGLKESWDPLVPYVKKCAFVWREAGRNVKEEQVFCEQHTNEEMSAPLQLISSDDWFKKTDVVFKSVVEFAMMSEFIVVAAKGDDGKTLHLDASLDANTFAEAKFPPKFFDIHQTAYTVLDSSTHAVFLHVTVNPRPDQEYGSLIKSNSNGTYYVLSLNSVNRNTAGYVDFEKMQGLEGVALANIVVNVDKVNEGAKKQKQTRITHNDGADWEALQAPQKDADGKPIGCDVSDKAKCSLHIHGYTERADPREMYSSPTAVGLMLGVGNIGPELSTFGEANTYMTTDAGLTWKEIKKGTYAWEFGDQGSVIVIVRRGEDTDHLYYSLDSGEKWDLYKFSPHAIRVDSITTVPSDTSLNFLLWGKDSKELVTVNVDFSGLDRFQKKCELNENDPTQGDYDLWSPQHPLQPEHPECLFGHVAQYHRKKANAKCRNGARIDHMHDIVKNCTCTRRDYECDFNFERQPGGECKLPPGLTLVDPMEICETGSKEYWDNTPYRKIPLSTCEGGLEYNHMGDVHPCPGFEEEFEKKHGISGFGLFVAIVLPFAAAGGIGYYVWRNWDGKFGRIRLGDTGGAFDSDSPWVKWPIAAISGLVAVVAAIPMLVGSLYKMIAGRMGGGYGGRTYTSRSSFARGRGDYAVVDPDEGELLGDDSDEDV